MKKYLGLVVIVLLAGIFVVVIGLNPFSGGGVGPIGAVEDSPLTRRIDSLGVKSWNKEQYNSLKTQIRMETAAGELKATDTANYFSLLDLKYTESLLYSYKDWKDEGVGKDIEGISDVFNEMMAWKLKHPNAELNKATDEVKNINYFLSFQKQLDGNKRKEFSDSLISLLESDLTNRNNNVYALGMSDLRKLRDDYQVTIEAYKEIDQTFKSIINMYRFKQYESIPCSRFEGYRFYRDSIRRFSRRRNLFCN